MSIQDYAKKSAPSCLRIEHFHFCEYYTKMKSAICITKALINAVEGNLDKALIFCGSNVDRIKEIVSIKTLIQELFCN